MSASIADLFQRLTHGVHVVGVADGAETNAFTAAWVMQVSFDPLLLALSINPHHASYGVLRRGRAFSVNVLGKDQLALASHFGKPAARGKLVSVPWTPGIAGVPLLSEAVAWFECRLIDETAAGDHVLVVAEVVGGKLLRPDAEPLSYRDTGTMDGAAALFPAAFPTR
jgi:flavin reductase (DIM6/NTAB) family NADH-FMN oxidoreductase RutF